MTDPEWTVGIVAQTVSGEVVLRMTEAQADELRDQLVWLTEPTPPSVAADERNE